MNALSLERSDLVGKTLPYLRVLSADLGAKWRMTWDIAHTAPGPGRPAHEQDPERHCAVGPVVELEPIRFQLAGLDEKTDLVLAALVPTGGLVLPRER